VPRCEVGAENGSAIEINYEDHGSGQAVVLIHGYPLNGNSWERQEGELLAAGYRAISYDRRGWGRPSQPTLGYDYPTFAADLNALLERLDLHDVILDGFSMGTGEVTRHLGRYGSARVSKAALLGAIPPFLLKREDNPEGVDGQVFEDIKASIVKDRYAYFKDFLDNFYNVDVLAPDRISEQAWQARFNVAAAGSPHASYVCVDAWLTDFHDDLPKIDVPILVVHGTDDRIVISRRSTCPSSSCTAPRTASCRSPRPPTGCPTSSPTSASCGSRAARTTSAGPIPKRSTRPAPVPRRAARRNPVETAAAGT
jgi:non-heme chloroperoxidase